MKYLHSDIHTHKNYLPVCVESLRKTTTTLLHSYRVTVSDFYRRWVRLSNGSE